MTTEREDKPNPDAEVETGERRTKRRFAHELYPHPEKGEIRPLAVEVPYLYARAAGWQVQGTNWMDRDTPGSIRAAHDRIALMIAAHGDALLADALLQGLAGDEAWAWALERNQGDNGGEWVYERAKHYAVDWDAIKPYHCNGEPDHHDHYDAPDEQGWRVVHTIMMRESECPDCTELVPL